MKIVKKILLGIGGFIAFILVLGFILPSDPKIEQEVKNEIIPESVVEADITDSEIVDDNISIQSDEATEIVESSDFEKPETSSFKEPVANPTPATTIKSETKPQATPLTPQANVVAYAVTSITDGDTIKVNINGTIETLRIIGLDTPETVDPRKPVQCFGEEATNKAKELLSGKMVTLESDPTQTDRDIYGRLLRYVFLQDGTDFGKYMIASGYAYEYTYKTPYKYQSAYKSAQANAKANNLGLWSPNTCSGNITSKTNESSSTQTTQSSNQSSGKYYVSSYHNAKYYYPEACDGWKSLSEKYLESYNTLAELLKVHPEKTESPQCN